MTQLLRRHLVLLMLALGLLTWTSPGSASPEAPHVARCRRLIPHFKTRPCSWFEGWYVRITDPSQGRSFAAIVGTINGTGESMAAILHHHHCAPGAAEGEEGGALRQATDDVTNDVINGLMGELGPRGAGDPLVAEGPEGPPCSRTHVAQMLFQGGQVRVGEDRRPVTSDPADADAPDFEWSAPGVGFLRVLGFNRTCLSLTVGGLTLEANLTRQVPWQEGDPGAGPEGWAAKASQLLPPELGLPCHWFIHSLGSAASYRFTDKSQSQSQSPGPKSGAMGPVGPLEADASGSMGPVEVQGQGWAHEEKNWGRFFPKGHVWFQGVSTTNHAQVVGAVAQFRIADVFSSPDVISIGIRTPARTINLRSNDVGSTFFTRVEISPCQGALTVCAWSFDSRSSTWLHVCLFVNAPPISFSDPLHIPTNSATWEKTCRESFGASIQVTFGDNDSLARNKNRGTSSDNAKELHFHGAALEFSGSKGCVP